MEQVMGYVLLAGTVMLGLSPLISELRAIRRRLRVAGEVREAATSCTHREPAHVGLLALRPSGRTPDESWRGVPALHPVFPPVPWVAVDSPPIADFVSRRVAFERELAATGRSLDDLRIER
jgi:hypothetical protein